MKTLAILLLNYNGRKWLFDCIKSIQASSYDDFDIIVIDNASTDGSVEILEKDYSYIKLIKHTSNVGYCLGFNAGLRYAQSKSYDYALIMNNDSIIEPSAISFLIETSKKYDDSIVTGKVLDFESGLIQTVGKFSDPNSIVGDNIGFNEVDAGQYDRISKLDFCDDVILLYPLKHSKELGFYDEIFFLYYEELDFQINAKKAGIGIYYDYRAVIRHKGSLSSGGGTNKINSFYLSRNKILFISKHGNLWQKLYLIASTLILESIRLFLRNVLKKSDGFSNNRLQGKLDAIYFILTDSEPPRKIHESLN